MRDEELAEKRLREEKRIIENYNASCIDRYDPVFMIINESKIGPSFRWIVVFNKSDDQRVRLQFDFTSRYPWSPPTITCLDIMKFSNFSSSKSQDSKFKKNEKLRFRDIRYNFNFISRKFKLLIIK